MIICCNHSNTPLVIPPVDIRTQKYCKKYFSHIILRIMERIQPKEKEYLESLLPSQKNSRKTNFKIILKNWIKNKEQLFFIWLVVRICESPSHFIKYYDFRNETDEHDEHVKENRKKAFINECPIYIKTITDIDPDFINEVKDQFRFYPPVANIEAYNEIEEEKTDINENQYQPKANQLPTDQKFTGTNDDMQFQTLDLHSSHVRKKCSTTDITLKCDLNKEAINLLKFFVEKDNFSFVDIRLFEENEVYENPINFSKSIFQDDKFISCEGKFERKKDAYKLRVKQEKSFQCSRISISACNTIIQFCGDFFYPHNYKLQQKSCSIPEQRKQILTCEPRISQDHKLITCEGTSDMLQTEGYEYEILETLIKDYKCYEKMTIFKE